jgi:hypothetical protein|tara:strand:- start:1458 stop:3374 length:1917 start_codon:yes stop_codon:yes gene_type:complete
LWRDSRVDWDTEARDSIDFFLGNHYTTDESQALQSVGQADFVIDRVYAAIEKLKSLLSSRSPKFSAIGREDSDNRLALVWRVILEYVWDISDGDTQFKQAVHDYATTGLGYFYAYIDPEADYGRGEVKFTYVDPFRVYVDPASRHRYFDDAAGMILSTILTKDQILNIYPTLMESIDDIESMTYEEDYPSSQMKNSSKSFTPDEVTGRDATRVDRYRVLERFTKIKVPFYRIFNKQTGQESIIDQEQYQQFLEQNAEIIEAGMVDLIEVPQTRIKITCTVGDVLLYENILNTDCYPIVPVPNIWTNTPYPKSDVSKVKDSQRLLNKLFSLTLSHAQAAAGLKLLVPEGSVDDLGQLEKDWANPNAVIPYNPEFGQPHFPAPQSLAGEFYALIDRVEHYIDLSFGIPELMQGFREKAPDTAKGTAMLSQMGESRGKSKLRDIEGSLNRLGTCIYNLVKGHYNYQKTFRIVQPNNDMTEYTINSKMYDDKTRELQTIENDITIGQHDVRIISGSTLPSNRVAEYQMYLEAFKMGLVDDVEVLKKSEIFDKEGVLQRKGKMAQMQRYIEQLEKQMKDLSGDLQTAQRENVHSRKQVEAQKFKSELKDVLTNVKYDSKVKLDKLKNVVDAQEGIAKQEAKQK